MAGLSDTHVIETLDRYGFTRREPSPWRGEDPDGWDGYPVEIGDLPNFGRDESQESLAPPTDDSQSEWGSVADQINTESNRREPLPPPGPIDALAWYLPFHYYGHDWGIYIKEVEVLKIAAFIKQRLDRKPVDTREAQQLCRVALSVLYLHEAFHHKVESFATRLEIARLSAVYCRYDRQVFWPLLGTDDLLEEALACCEMYSRLRNEKSFHGNVDARIKRAALRFLEEWIPSLPPGYRRGLDKRIAAETGVLMSQVADGQVKSPQPAADWEVANHMIRGLFNKNIVAHVVVPIGTAPIIPWLNAARYISLSTRKVERHIMRDFGYTFDHQKGSHKYYRCDDRPRIQIPENREALAPRDLIRVANALGYENIRELAAKC